jgi:DNA invertase Pin-like site-specific DNA recombinase
MEAVEAFAREHGIAIVARYVERSGKLKARGRMLARAQTRAFDVVIVEAYPALGRTPVGAAKVVVDLHDLGIRVLARRGGKLDPTEPAIRWLAGHEQALTKRSRRVLQEKRERGEVAGTLRYGERRAPDGMSVEEDPAEQLVIERVIALHEHGLPLRQIGEELWRHGIGSRRGTPLLHPQIARILRRAGGL